MNKKVISDGDNESIREWLARLFTVIDAQNATEFSRYFTDEGRFVYGSNAPVIGKQAISDYVAGFFGTLESIQHSILDAWKIEDKVLGEVEVTYVLKDGRQFTLPAFILFKMEGELIRDYLIYVDPTPLFNDV